MERDFRPSTAKKIESAIDILEEVVKAEYERGKADSMMECGKADRPQGEWISFDLLKWGRETYACTACGESVGVPTCMGKPLFKFCPLCGAQMKGVDDETDRCR